MTVSEKKVCYDSCVKNMAVSASFALNQSFLCTKKKEVGNILRSLQTLHVLHTVIKYPLSFFRFGGWRVRKRCWEGERVVCFLITLHVHWQLCLSNNVFAQRC